MSTTTLPSTTSTLRSSFERLAKFDERYNWLTRIDPDKLPNGVCDISVDLFRIDPSRSKLEQTYHLDDHVPKLDSVVAVEISNALQLQAPNIQILVLHGFTFRSNNFLCLLAAIATHYFIDPEIFLLFSMPSSSSDWFLQLQKEEKEAFPSDRNVFFVNNYNPKGRMTECIFVSQLCSSRRNPKQKFLLVMSRDSTPLSSHISTTINWIKDLAVSQPDVPWSIRDLLIHSLLQTSPADLLVAQTNCRCLLAPFVRLLAASCYLSKLPEYESLAESLTDHLYHFFDDLRAVQDLHVSAQTFFGTDVTSGDEPPSIIRDLAYLRDRYEYVDQYRRSQIGYKASMLSLEESRLGIKQNQSVKRLTQLAFIFIPLSFLTSVFGMNIDVLTGDRAKWWTVVIGAVLVYIVVGISYTGVLRVEKWREMHGRNRFGRGLHERARR
ncbi:hypothetical protein FKW77_008178 [Venturia effusa]|uniref:Uncharacterized protein n=1 Tax=Venturia effusa TaxID=50376 RepID=A0A517KWY4_9PEZI|nr:hypothetical protein FKW77_008178 [Venturia effusa]